MDFRCLHLTTCVVRCHMTARVVCCCLFYGMAWELRIRRNVCVKPLDVLGIFQIERRVFFSTQRRGRVPRIQSYLSRLHLPSCRAFIILKSTMHDAKTCSGFRSTGGILHTNVSPGVFFENNAAPGPLPKMFTLLLIFDLPDDTNHRCSASARVPMFPFDYSRVNRLVLRRICHTF